MPARQQLNDLVELKQPAASTVYGASPLPASGNSNITMYHSNITISHPGLSQAASTPGLSYSAGASIDTPPVPKYDYADIDIHNVTSAINRHFVTVDTLTLFRHYPQLKGVCKYHNIAYKISQCIGCAHGIRASTARGDGARR
jgi:hypothetical protein